MDRHNFETLLLDQHAGIRQTLREVLQARFPGLRLTEANTAREAMERLDTLQPALAIIELQPDSPGAMALIRHVRALSPITLILTLTDRDLPEYRQAALAAGSDAFLSKREDRLEQVLEHIDRAMRKYQADAPNAPQANALRIRPLPGSRWPLPTPPGG